MELTFSLLIAYYLIVHDPEKRPNLYAKATDALEKAIKVTPGNYDGYYLLALQLAEMRDISKAILTVKQSLGLNASHIPSWHLLALLLSSQKDYERALNICVVAAKESEWDLATTDALTASQLDGEEYLALRITQAVLQDQIQGPESALVLQEALFSLYTKVFAPGPSSLGESMYDIQSIRRRDHSDVDTVSNATVVGRPRAGSILSVRSRNGTGSDLGHQSIVNGNSNTLGNVSQKLFFLYILSKLFLSEN